MKKLLFSLTVLLLAILCASSCGRPDRSPSSPAVTGLYPQSGPHPAPSSKTLEAVPYSYQGTGDLFQVTCTIRALTPEEAEQLLQSKKSSLSQMAQNQQRQQDPERAGAQTELIQTLQQQILALEEAETLYATEVLGVYTGTAPLDGRTLISLTLSSGDTVYLSTAAAADAEPWVFLVSTADGAYSEGVLLPPEDSYQVQIRSDGLTDTFSLESFQPQGCLS